MRHRVAGRKLSRPTAHRLSMYFNLAAEVLRHESIMTTEAKAKEARIMTDKMITLGKSGGLHSRRQALALLGDKKVVGKVFGELATRYANRSGGYTRVLKTGSRRGDGAPMALLELVR